MSNTEQLVQKVPMFHFDTNQRIPKFESDTEQMIAQFMLYNHKKFRFRGKIVIL